ncbi:MAG: hypothetical protein GX851_08245 [Clostridiales bacterium]|nr:hypothetical protein [Clostridiales bacterium]
MSSITRVLASFMALLAALFSLLMPAEPEEPRFPETKVREKIAFDEGEFVLKSCDIMVSPQGDDKNHGTSDAPLKTPEAAKERAKLLKDADCGHVTVWFREGVYTLSDTLEFTADDLTDVTYRSYPNERVVFSAAMEITGWTRTTVNGVNAFVTDCAINSEGDFFNAVYNGETRLKRPVYPKVGEFSVSKALDDDAFRPDIELFKLHAAFYANTSDVMSFKNLNDVDVRILHYWNDELLPILSLDPATGRIETQKPASMTIFENDRFFFENVFEALSEPGEWYLDRTSEKLYYIPFAGETPENTVLNASLVEQLVTLDGCKNVSFQGIEFRDSAWDIHSGEHWSTINNKNHPLFPNLKYQSNFPQACFDSPCAVTLKGCETVTFADCEFKNIGSSALMFGEGSRSCRAEACKFDNYRRQCRIH